MIANVPGYAATAKDLRRVRIEYSPCLVDRATTGLNGVVTLGPEPFVGAEPDVLVSVAGTLIHEHWHTRQHPLRKTRSFWAGIITRTHPMRRYEEPAYARQTDFLTALADARPELRRSALRERVAVLDSFAANYGSD